MAADAPKQSPLQQQPAPGQPQQKPQAPQQQQQQPQNFFPLNEGSQWTYNVKSKDQTATITQKIGRIELLGDQRVAGVETYLNEKFQGTENISSTDKGIFRHRTQGADFKPPVPMLRYPIKKGDTWDYTGTLGGTTTTTTSQVDVDKVTVPAGTYQAAIVTTKSKDKKSKSATTIWFAPGVGIVKQVQSLPKGVEVTLELTQYEPGK